MVADFFSGLSFHERMCRTWGSNSGPLAFQAGHGHTTTWYKFLQHFKAFIIPIILYQFQKDPFCLIILYDILFLFHTCMYSSRVGDNFLMEAERSYQFDHGLHVSTNSSAR